MFFAAWFYQKCKFKTREDLLSRIMLGVMVVIVMVLVMLD